jgi:branched-chain amino acid transport system substrate-binding protein
LKKLAVLLCVLLCAGALAAFAGGSQEPVRIGLQGPITGDWAYEGQMAKQAADIAATLINEKGGVLGRKVEILVEDDGGQPQTGALAATKISGTKGVVAAVSSYGSSITEPASGIYEKKKMVNIAYGATATRLTEGGKQYFFRTCGRDDSQGKFFADFVPQKFSAQRIAIMHDNTAFGKGLA